MGWSLEQVLVGTVLAENGYIYEELITLLGISYISFIEHFAPYLLFCLNTLFTLFMWINILRNIVLLSI